MKTATDIQSKAAPARRDRPWQAVQFLALNGIYLLLVFGWTLRYPPSDRDLVLFSHPEMLPWLVRGLWSLEIRLFGAWWPGYHIVNLMLLYACMVSIFFLTRRALRGPWWLGSLAAVMTMASPVKSEAVLALSGVMELLPAGLSLLTLLLYAADVQRPGVVKQAGAVAVYWLGVFGAGAAPLLAFVPLLWEGVLLPPEERRWGRVLLLAALGLAALAWRVISPEYPLEAAGLTAHFAPLLLVLYPLGLLPETLAHFAAAPWLGGLLGLGLAAGVLMLWRATRSPGLLWGVLSALLVRVLHTPQPVDLATLEGGGSLFLSLALANMAFAAFCFHAVQHPKWHRPIVFLTTMLCVVLFLMQAQSNMKWRDAVQGNDLEVPVITNDMGTWP
jgi:hypothetical protein